MDPIRDGLYRQCNRRLWPARGHLGFALVVNFDSPTHLLTFASAQ